MAVQIALGIVLGFLILGIFVHYTVTVPEKRAMARRICEEAGLSGYSSWTKAALLMAYEEPDPAKQDALGVLVLHMKKCEDEKTAESDETYQKIVDSITKETLSKTDRNLFRYAA